MENSSDPQGSGFSIRYNGSSAGMWRMYRLDFCLVRCKTNECQVNILAFLSTTFFSDALRSGRSSIDKDPSRERSDQKKALWTSFGFGLANFLFTYPAWLWIDSKASCDDRLLSENGRY